MPFVLRYNSTSRTLAEWGITAATITRRNQDADELQFTVAVENLFDEPAFAYGGIIQVFNSAGTRIYRGTVVQVRAIGDGQQERYRITAQNAWWEISRIVYQQYRAVWNSDFSLLTSLYSSRVTLGQSVYGHKITTNTQIVEIANYALSQSASLFAAPTIAELVIPPLQEARDITCDEAIRRMLAYTPDAIVYFDYAPTIPVMYITRRASLSAVSLDVSAGTIIRGLDSLTSRPDLVPAGVVFTFITQERDPAETDGPLYPRPDDIQVAGASAGPGVLFATIELSLQGGDNPEPVPALLADHYYSALSMLHWEGSITLQEVECSGLVKVGNRLNLTNGRAAWATMGAVVQQTVEDLLAGTTEITLGPPDHLGPQDFVALMERFRLNRPTSDFPESQHNGDEGFGEVPPNPDVETPEGNPRAATGGGGSPGGGLIPVYTTVDLEVCVDGVAKTARVVGSIF